MKPISPKIQLAGNPKSSPLFSVSEEYQGKKIELADPRATRALVALMDMEAVLGGAASHWGGPAALAELMSALHGLVLEKSREAQKEWFELFHLVNDGGHCENGLYALKANLGFADLSLSDLKLFRSIESPLTGHGESHLFPEGVYLSNGPLGSALPQSQGLAMADRLSGSQRVTVTTITDGACMEGEAREALASLPGLAAKGLVNPFVLVISDNKTKLSGRIEEDSFSMDSTFRSLSALGWEVIELEKGHDLSACLQTLEKSIALAQKNPNKPVAIHAHTIKGYGVKATMDSASGGHGFPLKNPGTLPQFLEEIYGADPLPSSMEDWLAEIMAKYEASLKEKASQSSPEQSSQPTKEKIQVGVAKALVESKKNGLPIISVTSDLAGSTGVQAFRKEFPESSFDVGVAESNMINVAAGFAKQGYIPVVDTFAQFGVTKGALPLMMSSLSQAPVIAIFSHTGFQDAADGASHQALTYLAKTASIPGYRSVLLSCSQEAQELVSQAVNEYAEDLKAGRPPLGSLFFLGRENFLPQIQGVDHFCFGENPVIHEGSAELENSCTLLVGGSLVREALKAGQILENEGVGVRVQLVNSVSELDINSLKDSLKKTKGHLAVLEDHQEIGGLGALLSHRLLKEGVEINKFWSFGVQGQFGRSAYSAAELYQAHGLDHQSVAQKILADFRP